MLNHWLGSIVLTGTGLVAGAIVCEVALRLMGISYPQFYQYDPYVGASTRPGAEGLWAKEGGAYVRMNSEGFRDREHAHAKPLHTLRIAVIGDSYAEALQVPMEDAFWAILERKLDGCPALAGLHPEVLSFGVSGFGTAQELMMLRHRVWSYAPDVVLIAFVTGNDIRNNFRPLEQDNSRPYFIFENARLVPDMTFRDSWGFRLRNGYVGSWVYWARNRSRTLQALWEAKGRLATAPSCSMSPSRIVADGSMNGAEEGDTDGSEGSCGGDDEAGLDVPVYTEPRNEMWKEAWQITEALLLLMRQEIEKAGASFLVVTLSNGIQVHPNREVRQAFAKRLGVPHLFYPDLRIKDLGNREGIAVLNLAPLFQSYAEENGVFLHGFNNSGLGTGHWNKEGHRLAGELIAQRLCEDLQHEMPSRLFH